jgi:hypothetical protein
LDACNYYSTKASRVWKKELYLRSNVKTVAVVVSVESEQRVDGCKWTRGKRTTSQPSQPLPHPFHSVPPMLLKASGNFKVNRGGYNFFVCRYFFERRGRMVC